MGRLRLTLACQDYDRTRPLLDGSIQPDGIELTPVVLPPAETFRRMLQFREFDASEMSLSNYCTLKARGDSPFVAIPVFLSRLFRHSCIFINAEAGITRPQELKGRRIGLQAWESTGMVFQKGLLEHEYGVASESVAWFLGPQDEPQPLRGHSYQLPDRIRLSPIPPGHTLSAMLERGELEALLTIRMPAPFLRGSRGSPRVRRLFPNYKEVEQDYFRRTRIFPIMHTVVIREEVYRQYPFVAASLYQAFAKAKERALRELYDTDALRVALPWVLRELEETWDLMGRDFWPYGVEPSRPTLEAITQYLVEQGLAQRVVPVEELFVPNVSS